jgi:hypothetical protein
MPKIKTNGGPMGQLSIGNVVTGGIRLYRDHFQEYYLQALIGSLWAIVPIYGWARYAAMHGLIARLAFREASERPETVQEARRQVQPRMWHFLGAGILIFLILMGGMFGGRLVVRAIVALMGAILGQNSGLVILLSFLGFLALGALYVWLYTKLSIVELPIAIENLGAIDSIKRSWNLTKGMAGRLIGVYLLTFIIGIPVVIGVQLVTGILTFLLPPILPMDIVLFIVLYILLYVGFIFAGSALLVPFWQSIKGLVYYDLCSRQEGMGLKLQDDFLSSHSARFC